MPPLALEIGAGLALFLAIEPLFHACRELPPESYAAPLLWLAALTHWPVAVAVSLCTAMLLGFRRRLRWRKIECGREARVLCTALAAVLAWAFSSYEANYFYGQPHGFDRALLIGLAAAVPLHPGFVGLFVIHAFLMAGQFELPLQYSWTDKVPLFDLLVLLQAFLLIRLMRRDQGLLPFLGAALCLAGAFYLRPGLEKLALGWVGSNEMSNLLMSAVHQNAWLGFLEPESVRAIRAAVAQWNPLLGLLTILVEVGVVFLLLHPRAAVALLLVCVPFHVGVFASSGIFFWKWIAMDLALAAAVLALPAAQVRRLFGWRLMLWGAAMMTALGFAHRHVIPLAWYDAPLSAQFRLEAVGQSGRVYQLPAYRMAPYDLPFAQGRFHFLGEAPGLVGALGSTRNAELLSALGEVVDGADLESLRRRFGEPQNDPARARRFDLLVRRYFAAEPGAAWLPPWLRAPQHIWSWPDPRSEAPVYDRQEPVTSLRVRRVEALHRDGELRVLSDRLIRTVRMDEAPSRTLP